MAPSSTGQTCHVAGSNVISSPRWFLSAAFRVLPGGCTGVAGVDAKGGDSLRSSGQAALSHPAFPPWLFITLHPFSLGQEAALCSLLEIKGDTGRAGGKAGGS